MAFREWERRSDDLILPEASATPLPPLSRLLHLVLRYCSTATTPRSSCSTVQRRRTVPQLATEPVPLLHLSAATPSTLISSSLSRSCTIPLCLLLTLPRHSFLFNLLNSYECSTPAPDVAHNSHLSVSATLAPLRFTYPPVDLISQEREGATRFLAEGGNRPWPACPLSLAISAVLHKSGSLLTSLLPSPAAMDYAAFHIVYVDKRVSAGLDGKYLHEAVLEPPADNDLVANSDRSSSCAEHISSEIAVVKENLINLLSCFNGAKLSELESNEDRLEPTLIIVDAAMALEVQLSDSQSSYHNHRPYSKVQSSTSQPVPTTISKAESNQESNLLKTITSRIARSELSNLVIPVAFTQSPEVITRTHSRRSGSDQRIVSQEMLRCIDDGAADVYFSPLALDCIRSISFHAYRARKANAKKRASLQEAKKSRKRSWVGIDDRKPYAYLREEMVSGLMTGICSPDQAQPTLDHSHPDLDFAEDSTLAKAIGSWSFPAHDFSEDQLVHAAFLMLQHALSMADLERWRLPAGTRKANHRPAADLKAFLLASRAAYNSFVHYHNFRHVVDVMQAVFYFLLRLGAIPPYHQTPFPSPPPPQPKSPVGNLLQPFDVLTLLISAIGHDVGHPGVNNAFLVALNAPLAQLYNDKSVLESFHCAAYSQILRRCWHSVFEDTAMRGLMINSILATDMGLHFKYMADLGNLQEKVYQDQGTEGWSPQALDECRALTCALLIKCADISNVARPFDIAVTWADILQLEFANQGVMENDLGMSTTLFGGPPELGNLTKLANSQNGFMKIYACPLFEAVSDVLPSMNFAVEEMRANQDMWRKKIEKQQPREEKKSFPSESLLSLRSESPSRSSSQPELSHPEGLPASQTSSNILTTISPPTKPQSEEQRRASDASGPYGSSDPVAQAHQQGSRRSSSGAQIGYSGSVVDPNFNSRRSSGAFSAGHSIPQTLAARRSSNTSPSQLQLTFGTDLRSQAYPAVSAAENVQPGRRGSDGTLSHTNASIVTSDTGSRNISIAGGGGSNARKGSKSNDGDQTLGQHRSTAYSMNRHSPYPALERHSSGGHTSRSQSVPYSPTETQATSVTEDSDDRSHQARERGGSITVKKGPPEAVNVEKPGSGHRLTGYGSVGRLKGADVKTTVVNGGSSGQHSDTSRLVTRKSSRFLNFWKKRGKATEPSI
ncbi:MAG: hypothetical protein Q9181_001328 [Wetmoreana brouardii]